MVDRWRSKSMFTCLVLVHVSACAQDAGSSSPADGSNDASAELQETPCLTSPEKLVQLAGRWTALAVGKDAIYLAKDAVWRMPKRVVSDLQHFATSPGPIAKLIVHADRLFWLVAEPVEPGSALFAADKSGGGAAAVPGEPDAAAALNGSPVALTTSQAFVFAAFKLRTGPFRIVRVGGTGSSAEAYVEIQARRLVGLAADDDQVYVSTDAALGAWSERGELRSSKTVGAELIADEAFIYYRQDDTERGHLVRAPKDTLEPEDLVELPSTDRLKLATAPDDASIYWADESGAISRAPKAGGTSELIATTGEYDDDDFHPLLAVDDTSLYWIGGEAGTRASDGATVWLYRICK